MKIFQYICRGKDGNRRSWFAVGPNKTYYFSANLNDQGIAVFFSLLFFFFASPYIHLFIYFYRAFLIFFLLCLLLFLVNQFLFAAICTSDRKMIIHTILQRVFDSIRLDGTGFCHVGQSRPPNFEFSRFSRWSLCLGLLSKYQRMKSEARIQWRNISGQTTDKVD